MWKLVSRKFFAWKKSSGWHKRFTSSVEDVAGWTAQKPRTHWEAEDETMAAWQLRLLLFWFTETTAVSSALYKRPAVLLSFSMLLFDVKKRIEISQSKSVIWFFGLITWFETTKKTICKLYIFFKNDAILIFNDGLNLVLVFIEI